MSEEKNDMLELIQNEINKLRDDIFNTMKMRVRTINEQVSSVANDSTEASSVLRNRAVVLTSALNEMYMCLQPLKEFDILKFKVKVKDEKNDQANNQKKRGRPSKDFVNKK